MTPTNAGRIAKIHRRCARCSISIKGQSRSFRAVGNILHTSIIPRDSGRFSGLVINELPMQQPMRDAYGKRDESLMLKLRLYCTSTVYFRVYCTAGCEDAKLQKLPKAHLLVEKEES